MHTKEEKKYKKIAFFNKYVIMNMKTSVRI